MAVHRQLSLVIPTLNAARTLPATLAQFAPLPDLLREIVVSDGGSSDATPAIAEAAGARLITGPRGRGAQLARGAAAASGDWLLFLHADTRLGEGWQDDIAGFIAAGDDKAGYFAFALDDDAPPARRLERAVAWRCRRLALPYGDQGLLIARRLYEEVGGFKDLPLMEDVDLVARLGRARLALLRARAITSAARYQRDGYLRRSARNLACLALWRAGLPPRLILRLYG